MAGYILADHSFFLNNLFYPGSFLFVIHEDALAFTQTNFESNVALLFSIVGNSCARVLMAGCFKQQARSKRTPGNQWVRTKREGTQQNRPVMAPMLHQDGPLHLGAAWCCGAWDIMINIKFAGFLSCDSSGFLSVQLYLGGLGL